MNVSKPKIDKDREKRDPFRTDRNSTNYMTGKLVGGYLPQQVAEHFHLLAIYHETNIQHTLQDIIENWCLEKESIPCILETLADRAYMEWTRRISAGADSSKTSQDAYLKEIQDWLERHKITSAEYIKTIISQLQSKIEIKWR